MKKGQFIKKGLLILLIVFALVGVWDIMNVYAPQVLNTTFGTHFSRSTLAPKTSVKVLSEESVTISDVKKVGPSVVTIVGKGTVSQQQVSPFDPFGMFGFGMQMPMQQVPQQSVGSGFVIDSKGLIVTNKHVVADTSETYEVITANNQKYSVKAIYRDPSNDIAIVKIDPSEHMGTPLQPVSLGDSSHLQVGQFVVAIGTALGEFRNTVTTGVVSGLGRGITAGDMYQGYTENLSNVIQTSAAINPGNSGGPLVDSSGQVIGMNTAVAQNGQNIGFAIPINLVKDAIKNFTDHGQQFSRPFLGVSYKYISQSLALLNGVPQGAYVASVVAQSPAQQAGIQQGDIIIKLDGVRVDDKNNQLATLIGKKQVGEKVDVTIWRNGKTMDVSAILGNASTPGQ